MNNTNWSCKASGLTALVQRNNRVLESDGGEKLQERPTVFQTRTNSSDAGPRRSTTSFWRKPYGRRTRCDIFRKGREKLIVAGHGKSQGKTCLRLAPGRRRRIGGLTRYSQFEKH